MATIAGPLIDQILARVRDPEGVIATRDFVRDMLGRAQQLVNSKLSAVVDETPLTTEPLRCFYPLVSLVPESQKVTFVRDSYGKDLLPVVWQAFWYMKRGWPREVAERMQVWSTVGRDVLVLWPARRVPETVTVVSARLTPPIGSESEALESPDDLVPAIADLTVVLVLLKMRKVDMASESMQTLAGRLAARE